MPDFSVRSDSVNVEQIMEQIRARILEKRGADYTEQEIRDLAAVKLEKFLDPQGLRSDLLEQFRQRKREAPPAAAPNYAFEDSTLYDSHRAPLRWIRKLLQPILKLFFNPNPLIQALHIQAQVNTINQERETARQGVDQLHFELLHNLVLETTRLSIELKNLKMRVESMTSRLEFNERRARALESVVVYKPGEAEAVTDDELEAPPTPDRPAATPPAAPAEGQGPGQRSRRRRRRRGRRGGSPATTLMAPAASQEGAAIPMDTSPEDDADGQDDEAGFSMSDGDEPESEARGGNEPHGDGTDPES